MTTQPDPQPEAVVEERHIKLAQAVPLILGWDGPKRVDAAVNQAAQLIATAEAEAVRKATEELRGKLLSQDEQLKALVKTDAGFGGYVDALVKAELDAQRSLRASRWLAGKLKE